MLLRNVLILAALATAPAAAQQTFPSSAGPLRVETVARGLDHPWALQFLPDGRMLVTERPGRLRVVGADGRLSAPVAGVPEVSARGQGGLLDVRLAPDFAQSRRIFFCFAEPRGDGNGTSLATATLNADTTALVEARVIFRQQPSYNGTNHYGCRIVPASGGTLYLTVGERYDLRDQAQNPANHLGKVLRLQFDGSPAPVNPALTGMRPGWRPEIWSIGHRNVQGADLNPQTGELWTAEHGARGGDEINIPRRGLNYGWPVITYGRDYSGAKIGEGTHKEGMEQPLFYWDPSIAPSGAAFYAGAAFPTWKGDFLVGALAGKLLARLKLDGDKVVGEERLLAGLGKRIRDVRVGPDGFIYLVTDEANGEILRVRPGG